jgi:GRAM domain
MFITQRFMAFSGWPDTRVLLALHNITAIEKTNTLIYLPNAILLTTADKEEYFFGSFIDRDPCYSLLTSMSEVSKRLMELGGISDDIHSTLVFGIQTADSSAVSVSTPSRPISPPSSFAPTPSAGSSVSVTVAETAPTALNVGQFKEVSPSDAHPSLSVGAAAVTPVKGTERVVGQTIPSSALKTAIPQNDDVQDGVVLSTLFSKSGVVLLNEIVLDDISGVELWRACWMRAKGYG